MGSAAGFKDVWVAEGSKIRGLRERTAAQMARKPMAVFEGPDVARAGQILRIAIANPPCPVQDDHIEDVVRCLELLCSRVATLIPAEH
jgi:hypothetical protein